MAGEAEALFGQHHQALFRYLCRAVGQSDVAAIRSGTMQALLRTAPSRSEFAAGRSGEAGIARDAGTVLTFETSELKKKSPWFPPCPPWFSLFRQASLPCRADGVRCGACCAGCVSATSGSSSASCRRPIVRSRSRGGSCSSCAACCRRSSRSRWACSSAPCSAATSLAGPLAFVGVVFVLLQVLTPIHQAISANLGDRTAAWLYDRLTEACVRPPGHGPPRGSEAHQRPHRRARLRPRHDRPAARRSRWTSSPAAWSS